MSLAKVQGGRVRDGKPCFLRADSCLDAFGESSRLKPTEHGGSRPPLAAACSSRWHRIGGRTAMTHSTFRNLRDMLSVAAAVGMVALLVTLKAVR